MAVLPYELFDSHYHPNVPHYVNYCEQFAAAMNKKPIVRTLGIRFIFNYLLNITVEAMHYAMYLYTV